LEFEPGTTLPANDTSVLVRRWDHKQSQSNPLHQNGIVLRKAKENDIVSVEILIEDGISVQFQLPDKAAFYPGDYWLIPARAATGGVMWSKKDDKGNPDFVDARFVKHHYAPIALIPDITANTVNDLRRTLTPIAK
jgi:hypothetical protein